MYSEAGVNPAAGCLPLLVQIPVFIGLYHVLLNFSPRGVSIENRPSQRRMLPAAPLRGLTSVYSPAASAQALKRSKSARFM